MGANSGPTTYGVGLGNVGSYQVSGVPWITGSSALGAEDIRVHFNSTGSGDVVNGLHFVLMDSKEDSYTFNVKAKEIYISAPSSNGGNASFTIVAELTQIPVARMYALTGSGLTTINGD